MKKILVRGEYLSQATVQHCECGCTVERYDDICKVRKGIGCENSDHEKGRFYSSKGFIDHLEGMMS
jgi:hypothetical protein